MRGVRDADLEDLAATIAVARLVLGPKARIQAPPNLIGDQYRMILAAGIDDWGGVSPLTPDHVNPERPWPQIDELTARTAAGGIHPARAADDLPALHRGEPWLDPRLAAHVSALADPATGLAGRRRGAAGAAVAGAGRRLAAGGPHRPAHLDRHDRPDHGPPRTTSPRSTATGTRSGAVSPVSLATPPGRGSTPTLKMRCARPNGPRQGSATLRRWLCSPPTGPPSKPSPRWPTTSAATSTATTSPTSSTATSTSPTSVTPAAGSARSLSAAPTPTPTRSRWSRSATGRRRPGRPVPPRSACRAASTRTCPAPPTSTSPPRSGARCPDMHVHAFSPMEVVNGASRTGLSIREWLIRAQEAGLELDPRDRRGDPRRRRALDPDQGQAAHLGLDRGDHDGARARPAQLVDDDVRARRHAGALGRAPAGAARHPGAHRRLHRVRAAAVHPRECADLPGRPGAPGPDPAGEPGRARDVPAAAARRDRQRSSPPGSSSARICAAMSCRAAPTTWAAP